MMLLLALALLMPQVTLAESFSGEMGDFLPIEDEEPAPAANPFAFSVDLSADLLKSPVISADDLSRIQDMDLSDILVDGEDRDDAEVELLEEPAAAEEEAAAEEDNNALALTPEQLEAIRNAINNNQEAVEEAAQANEPVVEPADEPAVDGDEAVAVDEDVVAEPVLINEDAVEEPAAVNVVDDSEDQDEAMVKTTSFDEQVESAKRESEERQSLLTLIVVFIAGLLVAGGTVAFVKRKRV